MRASDVLRRARELVAGGWHEPMSLDAAGQRAVEAYLANCARDPMRPRPGRAFDRLLNDVRYSLDHQHGEAWWFDGRWMVARGPERESLRRHFGITPRVEKTP